MIDILGKCFVIVVSIATLACLVGWMRQWLREPDPALVERLRLSRCAACGRRADVRSNLGAHCFADLNDAILGARAVGVPFVSTEVRALDGEWVAV